MSISCEALTQAFINMNFGYPPNEIELALIQSYAFQTTHPDGLTAEQALLATTKLVGDTSVKATLSYHFYAGTLPDQIGFQFLVDRNEGSIMVVSSDHVEPPKHASDDNRYYSFALNLGEFAELTIAPDDRAFELIGTILDGHQLDTKTEISIGYADDKPFDGMGADLSFFLPDRTKQTDGWQAKSLARNVRASNQQHGPNKGVRRMYQHRAVPSGFRR